MDKKKRAAFGGFLHGNQKAGIMLCTAAILLLMSSCKKDEAKQKTKLSTLFEIPVSEHVQKNFVDAANAIRWNDGDIIKVNGTPCEVYNGVVEVEFANAYAAVYPASATLNGSGADCDGGFVTIEENQTYISIADDFQSLEAPMVARLDHKSGVLHFKNLFSVVKVKVINDLPDINIKSISLQGENNELSGQLPFTLSGNTTENSPSPAKLNNGKNHVTLNFTTAHIIYNNNQATFFLLVAPFATQNLTLNIETTDGSYSKTTTTGIGLERSHIGTITCTLSHMDYASSL